jgi:hypothetical protein
MRIVPSIQKQLLLMAMPQSGRSSTSRNERFQPLHKRQRHIGFRNATKYHIALNRAFKEARREEQHL